ncbi:hypothetical protein EVAR_97938_1 [Eumeta japonica]|uniref:Gustatory receptor n=1 Tax=Eumeta variegata TaxID=151549 RepID=A0A4C1XW14_EUMVA|nr:hypothetical protein EVAR_97938_1 [Eumeta japonica]
MILRRSILCFAFLSRRPVNRQQASKKDNTPVFEELFISCRAPLPSLDPSTGTMDSSYYANTLSTSMLPLKVDDYKVNFPSAGGYSGLYEMTLINAEAKILSFGVWARTFKKDGMQPNRSNSAMKIHWDYFVIVIVLGYCLVECEFTAVLAVFYALTVLAASGESVHRAARALTRALARLNSHLCRGNESLEACEEARNVLHVVSAGQPRLSACGLFELRMSLVTGFLSLTATYSIVLLQFTHFL